MRAELRAWLGRASLRFRGPAIPVADLPRFRRAWRRSRLVRLVLAAALVICILAAFVVAPTTPGRRFLPANTVGIVVLDLSASIQPGYYRLIKQELETLASSPEHFGLVLFSDVAYEALPPGTPASELLRLVRFFTVPPGGGLPPSPWQQWFSGGTVISNGLLLAANMLQRENVKHGAVILISDLGNDPSDDARFASAVLLYQQRHIPLEIVGLNPTPDAAEYVKSLLGAAAISEVARLPQGASSAGKIGLVGSFPRSLAITGALLVLLLTFDEWWGERLRWRPRSAVT